MTTWVTTADESVASVTPVNTSYEPGNARRLPNPPAICRPPGSALRAIACLFPRGTRTRVLDPVIGDMLDEYFAALEKGELRMARWIRVRGTAAFLQAILFKTLVGRIAAAVGRFLSGR